MAYNANTKTRAKTEFIAIHCSATGPEQDIGAADIDRWHRKQGWACIGYHFVIRRDGTLEEGRQQETIGAHVEGFNSVALGICMAGGVDANDITKAVDNFTDEQWATLKRLLAFLKPKYPGVVIQGHRDFPNVHKACPSFDVKTWLKKAGL
jgi:N-acetylmuramoyl-L-alanine amidase